MRCYDCIPPKNSKSQLDILFVKNKIVGNKINKNIKHCIASATGDVPEGLQRNIPSEWRVKEINHPTNALTHPC